MDLVTLYLWLWLMYLSAPSRGAPTGLWVTAGDRSTSEAAVAPSASPLGPPSASVLPSASTLASPSSSASGAVNVLGGVDVVAIRQHR